MQVRRDQLGKIFVGDTLRQDENYVRLRNGVWDISCCILNADYTFVAGLLVFYLFCLTQYVKGVFVHQTRCFYNCNQMASFGYHSRMRQARVSGPDDCDFQDFPSTVNHIRITLLRASSPISCNDNWEAVRSS